MIKVAEYFKKTLSSASKCRDDDEIRGKHIYTEERIDKLISSVLERLAVLENYMIDISKEHASLRATLEELYKQNLKLVEQYGRKTNE